MCAVNLHTEKVFMTEWTCVKCSWSALRYFTTSLLNIGQIPLHTETLSCSHLKEMRFFFSSLAGVDDAHHDVDFSTMSRSCSESKIVSAITSEKMLSFGTDLRFDDFQQNLRDFRVYSVNDDQSAEFCFFADTED